MPHKFQLLAVMAFGVAMLCIENQIQKLEESRAKLGKTAVVSQTSESCLSTLESLFGHHARSILNRIDWSAPRCMYRNAVEIGSSLGFAAVVFTTQDITNESAIRRPNLHCTIN